uniref:high-affinity choline transporter 1-like n=1 Tax=Oncorhynchus gorbuscha TaxID=8017 RepID=UPI001EAEB691|nr:high-affinity choline transporter 1-like [Oncorhynchus gorbuscha]
MALDVGGAVAVVVFYVLILAIGIWASRKSKKEEEKCVGSKSEVNMIGGRNINVLVGVFTMTATWVGGGYIMGTAEAVYSPSQGLIWALGPLAYLITFLLAGLFFAKPMRSQRYVTMMDPFQHRYGNSITIALLLPALISDVLWVACILNALGGMMSVILGLSSYYSIALSAAVAITYTLMGGLYSVAYTDVIQLFFMFIALWLCVPFLVLNPASSEVTLAALFNRSQQAPLMGELEVGTCWEMDRCVCMWMIVCVLFVHLCVLQALGGLSYQALYQRILSAVSSTQAQVTGFAAAGIVIIMGVPSVIIGAVAASTDWNQTGYGLPSPFDCGEAGKVLPLALHYLTPPWVSVVGIGAVAAAVMSSMDSVLLSSASMFTHNIYKRTLKAQISGDLIYCVVFPQLICVLHCRCANGYGATAGYLVAVTLRLLSGEPLIRLPTALLFPGWREESSASTSPSGLW